MVNIAHLRQDNNSFWITQSLANHSKNVARIASDFAAKFGNPDWGYLLGKIHDLGKMDPKWQNYIKCASGYDLEIMKEEKEKRRKKMLEVSMDSNGMLHFESDLNLSKRKDMQILMDLIPMTVFSIQTSLFGQAERSVTAVIRSLSIGEICCCQDAEDVLAHYNRVVKNTIEEVRRANEEMVKSGKARVVLNMPDMKTMN